MGKSRLARMLLNEQRIASISTDALTSVGDKIWPDISLRNITIKKEWEMYFYPYLRRFIQLIQTDYEDYVIEGAVISPAMVKKLIEDFDIQCVFVGNSEITLENIQQFMGSNNWLTKLKSKDVELVPSRIIDRSKELRIICESNGYPYVDLAGDYFKQLKLAYVTLTGRGERT